MNNGDRKAGHCLQDEDGDIWSIDHGLTFHPLFKLRTVMVEFWGKPVPDELADDLQSLHATLQSPTENLPYILGELIDTGEMRALLKRLEIVLEQGALPILDPYRNVPWPVGCNRGLTSDINIKDGDMCGRYGLFAELGALAEQFDFDSSMMEDVYTPRWNIPPTVPVLTVQSVGANTEGVYRPNTAGMLRWGMTGARNPKGKGRRASAVQRGARRRCMSCLRSGGRSGSGAVLIPANGFYEWHAGAPGNRPACLVSPRG